MTQQSIENLFQSIDTIIDARIANLPFDQTIECEILKIDNNIENKYLIKYQASTFYAYSKGEIYSPGDIVYVQVPQGDFTQDKFILSKRSLTEKNKAKKMPFLSFVKNLNLFNQSISEAEYYVQTSSGGTESVLSTKTVTTFYEDGHLGAGYTRIGIKFAVKAGITESLKSGAYGVRLVITGYDQSKTYLSGEIATQPGNQALETRIFDFPMTEMVGSSIYNTLGYNNQEKVFDITNFVISSAQLVFYQNGKFFTQDNKPAKKYKIYFTNLQLYLGYDSSEFYNTDYKVFLYTPDGFYYNNDWFEKNIKIRFVKAEDNKSNLSVLTSVAAGSSTYSIHWEQYDPSASIKGPFSNLPYYTSMQGDMIERDYELSIARNKLTQSFVVIIQNNTNGEKYISNKLMFTSSAYLNSSELLEVLATTDFFSIDKNGYVFLNGGSNGNTASGGVNITNSYINNSTLNNIKLTGTNTGTIQNARNYASNGNIYANLVKIKEAIEALGGTYDIE